MNKSYRVYPADRYKFYYKLVEIDKDNDSKITIDNILIGGYSVLKKMCKKANDEKLSKDEVVEKLVPEFNFTSSISPRILLIDYRDYTHQYLVKDSGEVNKFLEEELRNYFNYNLIDNLFVTILNESGISSQEEIDSIPVETIRIKTQKEYDKYLKEKRECIEYNNVIQTIKDFLEGKKSVDLNFKNLVLFNALPFSYELIEFKNLEY